MTTLVRLPDGTARHSVAALARELGCRPSALYPHGTLTGQGRLILRSLPDPHNVGKRGRPRASDDPPILPPVVS